MEITLKTTTLFLSILLTGLSAGLFYAWEVSVIPGTKRLTDISYLEAMQHINRAILNPGFFVTFFGSLLMLVCSLYLQYREGVSLDFWVILVALGIYLIGTIGVTALINVPLNESLDSIQLDEQSIEQLKALRVSYEVKWNLWHSVRTWCSLISFACLIISQVFHY